MKARDVERRMLDIFLDKGDKGGVEIQVRPGPLGRTLWVNVDGVCRLRVGGITSSHIFQIEGVRFMEVATVDDVEFVEVKGA